MPQLQSKTQFATTHRSRYRFTPHRFLMGLLALEGFLLLCERFGWLGFDDRKGWPVLIGIAIVGLAVSLLLLWFAINVVLRRRFQFGILSLLLLVLAVATVCGWLHVRIQHAERQRAAVGATERNGAQVLHDWELLSRGAPPGPERLRDWLGVDFFAEVSLVQPCNHHDSMRAFTNDDMLGLTSGAPGLVDLNVSRSQVTDAGLVSLNGLGNLRRLGLSDTRVTDAGVAHLAGLRRLEYLGLNGTPVTDAGLVHLDGLTGLTSLALGGTQITDAGLSRLEGRTNLQWLDVSHVPITDTGVAHLESLTRLEFLGLHYTKVTDDGLAHLKRMTKIEIMLLEGTPVTSAGLENLQGMVNLERLWLSKTHVSDAGLRYLEGMSQLKHLDLSATNVTDEGVQEVQKALPKCSITHTAASKTGEQERK